MEPQEITQSVPTTVIPPFKAGDSWGANSTQSVEQYLRFLCALTIAVGAVYVFLAWSEPIQATTESHTAAVIQAVTPNPYDGIVLEAQSAFVVDVTGNAVLYKKNPNAQLPLASLTKVALVLVVSEVLEPDDVVTISEGAVTRGEGGLAVGDTWKVKNLIDYTLVASSNAGAEALAEAADAPIRARYPQAPEHGVTVWRMNELAKELGLSKTYFLNPSGLDLSPTQPSAMGSARDVTVLLAYAYKTIPGLFAHTAGKSLTVGPINGPEMVAENTNDAIGSISGLKIGKTGFTDLAGGNLSIVFENKDSHTLVATVLSSSLAGRFTDMVSIVETGREREDALE